MDVGQHGDWNIAGQQRFNMELFYMRNHRIKKSENNYLKLKSKKAG